MFQFVKCVIYIRGAISKYFVIESLIEVKLYELYTNMR